MEDFPLLKDLALIAFIGITVTMILARLKFPTVAGLLAAGALMSAVGLINDRHSIEVLAEIGVVLLLFSIGLEFSLSKLKDIFSQVALGGILQVGLTIAATWGIAVGLGVESSKAIFFGFAVSLSSTAVVLKTLTERQELDAPHAKFIVGTLIFQDLCIVPMVLIIPLLKADATPLEATMLVGMALGKAVIVIVALLLAARFLVPRFLRWVDSSRSREVFLLAVLFLCIGTAYLTSLVGMSLALGAFLGGVVIADTEYGHRAFGDILPLHDAFMSIFFVSTGMLFSVPAMLHHPFEMVGILVALLIGKGMIATIAAMAMKFPKKAAWLAGSGLAQFGEFGFVLTTIAVSEGVIGSREEVAPLLNAGILSMFLTPILARISPRITAGERILAPLERLLKVRRVEDFESTDKKALEGHVILIGFGVAGRLAAQVLQSSQVPLLILELNMENVSSGQEEGYPICYADATSAEALQHAHVADARQIILLINDKQAVSRIVDTAKRIAPHVPILTRTRYQAEAAHMFDLGVEDVVVEEFEGAMEIVSLMLRDLEVPRNLINREIDQIREQTIRSERTPNLKEQHLGDLQSLQDLRIETLQILDTYTSVGESAKSLDIRTVTGALMVGLRRNGKLVESSDPTIEFEPSDVLYLVGTSEALSRACMLLTAVTGRE